MKRPLLLLNDTSFLYLQIGENTAAMISKTRVTRNVLATRDVFHGYSEIMSGERFIPSRIAVHRIVP